MIETASIFRIIHGWEKHKQAFEDYKINGIQPDFYGRDASLSYPHIHHIHLAQSAKTREKSNISAICLTTPINFVAVLSGRL
mgnify:CR=1 FL=1